MHTLTPHSGYARVALVLASYYLAETNWKASSCFYLVAFAGDAVDGHVARKFKQASRFGAVLDMVTDRCSTAGLLLVLSRLYDRRHAFAFLVLMFIDLFSHWMHTHSVVEKHHKSTATLKRRNMLIRTYYDNLPFFAFCCIGAELFYVLLYLLHFVSEESRAFAPLRTSCFWLCLPACVLKQFVNIAQIFSAASCLALEELDQKER
ncbi:CDP-diacylglycerol-inositol 3-phosphatidyltransferase [Ectocarpus siliculosus]|uniref:CDP-diacylglycerol--inositol 3-phosphatidyltransferase n=1 Tax=Ectocarpus siliculosus TaxID=2880 RepID=D7FMQ7_ECTSI|nr:CDP-diacylglycerol-inositol 3-phosphatidyltransferase [Ectocarpus siliculosus]|eukprot:CBJ25954.1 CDP-diacylglycerol-inositol 3-phosphatidyltransferase [Ectocarpus siliculosus]